ncbi:uncharacterized protein [Watersipora subatra]|uniref:uncharacterized protein n=1 Tax=Watersipora subatra TaxID=2589382 RepID=UPI00355AE663
MAVSHNVSKDYTRKIRCPSPVISSDTIRQREELQKSVLKHTNRLINQLLKNLDEADNVIKKRLSPSHLERLINYLRDDIQPLRGFINKISVHAENLGSMKKEYELQGAGGEGLRTLSLSTTNSDSNSSFTRYMFDRTAREPSLHHDKVEPPSPPYLTPRNSPRKKMADGFVSKSCSPIRFDVGDGLSHKSDVSTEGDPKWVMPENVDLSQIVELSRRAISRELRKIYKTILRWILFWKYKLTGSQRIGLVDFFIVIILIFLLYRGAVHALDYSWKIYRTWTNMRRGIKPM